MMPRILGRLHDDCGAPTDRPIPGSASWLAWLVLGLAALVPGTSHAAVWSLVDATVSNSSSISLTTTSGKSIGRLADGSLYTVWYERRTQNSSRVRGARRGPEGTWVPDPDISLGDSLSINPSMVATTDGGVHVVWEDRRHNNMEIYYRHRTPAGAWEAEQRLTVDGATSESPVLAEGAAGRVHLVWSDGATGNLEIHYRHRDLDGTWSPAAVLTDDIGPSENPAIAVDAAGLLHVVWQDNVLDPQPGETGVNLEIYHQLLDGDGRTVVPRDRVSRFLGISHQPSIAAAADGSVHVFWSDNRDRANGNGNPFPFAIWYRRWLPEFGFGHEKRFCFSTAEHLNSSVACGPDGTVNVVWEDFSHGNSELYFRQIRPDTGWDVHKTRLTETLGATRGPGLISDPEGNLHLIWSDTGAGEQPSIRYRSGRVD